MITTSVTSKGQATIPKEVRDFLHVKPGGRVAFRIENQRVFIEPVEDFPKDYLASLSETLQAEWDSEADNEAYNDL